MQKEIKELHALYTSNDEETVSRLKPLFESPQPDESPSPADSETPAPVKKKKKKTGKKKANSDTSPSPTTVDKPIPYVRFQQVIIRDKLKTMSDEEAAAVEEHIEESYAAAVAEWEKPWLFSGTSGTVEGGLEAEYYQK